MAKSPFFARIKEDGLIIAAGIPAGKVLALRGIGAHLDVIPRHVAHILRMLDAEARAAFPADRAVAGAPAALEVAILPYGVKRQTQPAHAPAPHR